MRYRIALCGFSEFEYRAMDFSFRHPVAFTESAFDVVDALSDADFAVVDADSKPAVKGVVQSGRLAQAVFVGAEAPAGAASHLPRPIDPSRILRTLDELTARLAGRPKSPRRAPPPDSELPTLDDVVALPKASPAPTPTPTPAATPVPPPPAAPTAMAPGALPPSIALPDPAPRAAMPSAAKAAARAAARRARIASQSAGAQAVEPLRDVLVLDTDPVANTLLCALLERFGFQAHSVTTIAQAEHQLGARPFAAIFLEIVLNDAGVALLQHIRELPAPAEHPGPAVLMVSTHVDPADRVRAALAGLGSPLIKPLGRGDVARALESAGVILPADARRH